MITMIKKDYNKVNDPECLVCFNRFKWYECKVTCCLCGNVVHYKCYKKFIKKISTIQINVFTVEQIVFILLNHGGYAYICKLIYFSFKCV